MAMYLCTKGNTVSNDFNAFRDIKKWLCPTWEKSTPISSLTDLSKLNFDYYRFAASLAFDQHAYILPSGFNADYIAIICNNGTFSIVFSESPITLDSYYRLPNRYEYTLSDNTTANNILLGDYDITPTYAAATQYTPSGYGIYNIMSTRMILFSSYDITGSAGKHYKNIDVNDITIKSA